MVAPVRPPDNAAAGKGTRSSNVIGTSAADAAPAGSIGESVISALLGTAQNFPTSTTYGDATSIALTAGDWDVTANAEVFANGATVTGVNIGISQTSGNSGTGLVFGDNFVAILPPTAVSDSSGCIPSYRISLAAPATVYLKMKASFSVATPQIYPRLSARRAR